MFVITPNPKIHDYYYSNYRTRRSAGFHKPKAHSSQHNGLYPMKKNVYNESKDSNKCPTQKVLKANER